MGLSSAKQHWADEAIASWGLSSDPTKRFDALALIDHLGIRSAMRALKKLEAQLMGSLAHDAPYQLEDLRNIMARLS